MKRIRKSNLPKEAMLSEQDKMMEKAVINARKTLLPYFKKKDFTLEFTEWLCENVAVIVNGGAYDMMKKWKVSDLNLKKQVKPEYPNYNNFLEFLSLIDDMTMNEAINSLQWFSEKMKKTVKDENKGRMFKDINMEI